MVCFRKDLKISSFSFPKPITELCKKQKIVIEQLHEFLNSMKQWKQMQFINAWIKVGIAQPFVGKNAMFGFFALMNAVSAYDK